MSDSLDQPAEDVKLPLSQKKKFPVSALVERAAVRVFKDDGTPNGYGEMQEWVELDGRWYPIPWIKSIPGVLRTELVLARHVQKK